jgi:hypothetical protein
MGLGRRVIVASQIFLGGPGKMQGFFAFGSE